MAETIEASIRANLLGEAAQVDPQDAPAGSVAERANA